MSKYRVLNWEHIRKSCRNFIVLRFKTAKLLDKVCAGVYNRSIGGTKNDTARKLC